MSEPTKVDLSPALALSTAPWRRMTSTERGSEPAGTSSAFSWMRTRCQSTKRLCTTSSSQRVRFVQTGFAQAVGSVNLNCCSTGAESVPHSRQAKRP
jgi:hypothetical protein